MPAFPAISVSWSRSLLLSLLVHGLVLGWYGRTVLGLPASHSAPLRAHLLPVPLAAVSSSTQAPPPRLLAPAPASVVHAPGSHASSVKTATHAAPVPPVAAPTLALPAVSEGLDAGGLRAYKLALAVNMRRAGVLLQGLRADMHGRVDLMLTLSAQGHIVGVAVQQGSGNPALDHLAVMALSAAGQQVALPVSLQGQTFSVLLPLEVD